MHGTSQGILQCGPELLSRPYKDKQLKVGKEEVEHAGETRNREMFANA